MRLLPSEDQLALTKAVEEVLGDACPPAVVRAAQESGELEESVWRRLAELGLPGVLVPEEQGGLGLGVTDLVLALEETGRAALPGPVVETTLVAPRVVPLLLADADSRSAGADWLSRIADGATLVAAQALPSPYLAYADAADLLLVVTDGGLRAVPAGEVDTVAQSSVDGARPLSSVPGGPATEAEGARLLAEDSAAGLACDLGAVGTAAQLVGLARAMVDLAGEYAGQRTQFGRPIGSFQAVKHLLADALLAVEVARPVVHRAAVALDVGAPSASRDASAAKSAAGRAAEGAARAALQAHGAIGYTDEYDLQLWAKRAWSLAGSWGTARWHRRRAASAVLDAEPAARFP